MSVAKLQVSLVRLVRSTMLESLPACLFMDLCGLTKPDSSSRIQIRTPLHQIQCKCNQTEHKLTMHSISYKLKLKDIFNSLQFAVKLTSTSSSCFLERLSSSKCYADNGRCLHRCTSSAVAVGSLSPLLLASRRLGAQAAHHLCSGCAAAALIRHPRAISGSA